MTAELLINQMFAGRYLDEGENIGHEIINLFKDDAGHNNLFITPSGRVDNHEVKNILFVRNLSARTTVEVIGMAKGVATISADEVRQITYAGFSLGEIFGSNTYNGQSDIVSNDVTFRAEKFCTPLRRIIITLDENFKSEDDAVVVYLKSDKKVIIPQGMRAYYSDEIDCNAYRQLLNLLINNAEEGVWNEDGTDVVIPDGIVNNQSLSFLEIIRKEDDENVFSNLISYFFEYSHSSFQKFATDPNLLNIKDMSASFELMREKSLESSKDKNDEEQNNENKIVKNKGRIDIWIESAGDIIVIENKINSGINGITDSEEEGKQRSQLNSYYEYARKEALKKGKTAHFYIIAPDHANFSLDNFKSEIKENFKIIRYSDIYNFFISEAATYIADRAFPDFIRGLKRHTLSAADFRFDTMRSRLLRRINQLQ